MDRYFLLLLYVIFINYAISMKHKITFPFSLLSTQRSLLALLLLAIISSSVDAEEKLAIFDPMDVFDLEWASDPRVSPDGKTIVYVRRSNDIMKDRERSNLSLIHI